MPDFVLADFVHSVPAPITFALVSLQDTIRACKNVLQILNWRSGTVFDGFLLLFGWWALCLFAAPLLRYFLPVVIVASVVYSSSRKQIKKQVVTEQVLANAVSDLADIPTLLPSWPSLPNIPLYALLRSAAFLYPPYLFITTFISLRLLFAITGSILLTWRAPFAVVLRAAVWRSAFVRWAAYTAWARISGQPLPPKAIAPQVAIPNATTTQDEAPVTTSLRFLFTVYENQRWWMGLDWTAALLPGERPSWCSSTHAPLSPPGAFTLPEPTTIYAPHPTDKSKKVKKTAEWYWEEPEWTVLVRREGGGLSRVERPIPTAEDANPAANNAAATGSRLFKAASNRFANNSNSKDDASSVHSLEKNRESEAVRDDGMGSNEPFTDPDGWVYGDNKWENQSNKGGISKYTRYRRWTRVAVLSEFIQVVEASAESSPTTSTLVEKTSIPAAPIRVTKEGASPSTKAPASPIASSTTTTTAPRALEEATISSQPVPSPGLTSPRRESSGTPTGVTAGESPLRQRLRMALNK